DTDSKGRPRSNAEIVTARGTRIYMMPVETFPGHINNLYLVHSPEHTLLVDVGTQRARDAVDERFAELRRDFDLDLGPEDIDEVLISHAHIDHFGNAHRFHDAGIPLAIHELDARVLMEFEERLVLASRDLGIFLYRAGVSPDKVPRMVEAYQSAKSWFRSIEPSRRLRNGDSLGPGWPILHVPGHCPGLVCVAVDDVVLTTDHLLTRITPAQAPQSVTPFMGLENYLRSLRKLRDFGTFTLGLGAHEAPIHDVHARIDATAEHHFKRLATIHSACDTPQTISDISRVLFGDLSGYSVQLGLNEAGAHVEFLHALGYLVIDNLAEVASDLQAPTTYRQSSRPLPEQAPPLTGSP
ncbi:MAG: MBL fold metallo-hydrolase, partial [Myxococcota bacterium]